MSKIGKQIESIIIGEKLTISEKIEDKDLLLYLGLTNDSNPIYIQHDFASKTDFGKPIVPTIMLTGIITSAVSKYLPGPGSHIIKQILNFPIPAYHYSLIEFTFVVREVLVHSNEIVIQVIAHNEDDEVVVDGVIHVKPPRLTV